MPEATSPIPALAPAVAQQLQQARAAVEAGQTAAAYRAMLQVAALAPGHPEVQRWMAIAADSVGETGQAVQSYRIALQAWPDDADLHSRLGMALYRLGQPNEAIAHLQRASALVPRVARHWYNLAEALQPQAQTAAAIDALQKALAIDPDLVRARVSLAHAQTSAGQIEAAQTSLREALARESACVDAWVALANLKTAAFDADDVRQLEALLATETLATTDHARIGFALAHALEDQDDYERAWATLQQANAVRRRCVQWDGAGEHRRVDAMLKVFDQPIAAAGAPGQGSDIIFIASLPRSGSTLVEQILASHPLVEGANEIADLSAVVNEESARRRMAFPLWLPRAQRGDWQRLGETYLARTAHWRERKPRMTDKNLLNWLLAGTALSMLPEAKVVLVRRDPVETCMGCYRQWFSGDEGFTCDLRDMAVVYGDFWRLTRFWSNAFSGRVFNLALEDLVARPEPVIRQMLQFCNLPFDPACLSPQRTARTVLSTPSAMQVRQPIHRTVSRAARYADKLDPLRDYLRDAGVPIGF